MFSFALRKRTKHSEFYQYSFPPHPEPSAAQIAVFEARYSNQLYSFGGPGRFPSRSLSAIQPPQVVVRGYSLPHGYGGNVAGQYVIDPVTEDSNG